MRVRILERCTLEKSSRFLLTVALQNHHKHPPYANPYPLPTPYSHTHTGIRVRVGVGRSRSRLAHVRFLCGELCRFINPMRASARQPSRHGSNAAPHMYKWWQQGTGYEDWSPTVPVIGRGLICSLVDVRQVTSTLGALCWAGRVSHGCLRSAPPATLGWTLALVSGGPAPRCPSTVYSTQITA